MRITWFVEGALEQRDGQLTSSLASVRYRVLSPAQSLARHGHQVRIVRYDASQSLDVLEPVLHVDAVVISKVLSAWNLELVERARRGGARVVFDLCDDHFRNARLAPTYFGLCERADRIVCSTTEMAAVTKQHTGRDVAVIEDPFEAPAGEARFAPPADRLRLLWFGHPTNFDTLGSMIPRLARLAEESPLELHVVSDPAGTGIVAALSQVEQQTAARLKTRFTPWSAEATWQAMADADLVVVPSGPDQRKQVKSPNRVIESIRGGRFVTAYPVPSYRQFAEYAWLGEDVSQGVRWALRHPEQVRERIRRGQDYIAARFSPDAIASKWDAALSLAVEV